MAEVLGLTAGQIKVVEGLCSVNATANIENLCLTITASGANVTLRDTAGQAYPLSGAVCSVEGGLSALEAFCTGNVTVVAGDASGNYSISAQVCSVAEPGRCSPQQNLLRGFVAAASPTPSPTATVSPSAPAASASSTPSASASPEAFCGVTFNGHIPNGSILSGLDGTPAVFPFTVIVTLVGSPNIDNDGGCSPGVDGSGNLQYTCTLNDLTEFQALTSGFYATGAVEVSITVESPSCTEHTWSGTPEGARRLDAVASAPVDLLALRMGVLLDACHEQGACPVAAQDMLAARGMNATHYDFAEWSESELTELSQALDPGMGAWVRPEPAASMSRDTVADEDAADAGKASEEMGLSSYMTLSFAHGAATEVVRRCGLSSPMARGLLAGIAAYVTGGTAPILAWALQETAVVVSQSMPESARGWFAGSVGSALAVGGALASGDMANAVLRLAAAAASARAGELAVGAVSRLLGLYTVEDLAVMAPADRAKIFVSAQRAGNNGVLKLFAENASILTVSVADFVKASSELLAVVMEPNADVKAVVGKSTWASEPQSSRWALCSSWFGSGNDAKAVSPEALV